MNKRKIKPEEVIAILHSVQAVRLDGSGEIEADFLNDFGAKS